MTTTLRIEGMRAVHAVRALETALASVPGISSLDVRLGWAVIEHDGRATAALLHAAVTQAGLEVVETTVHSRQLPTRRSSSEQ